MLLPASRPFAPCPEDTPLPSRKNTKEHRAKLLSIYLRPWTLVPEDGTVEVPFLTDINMTAEQWSRKYEIAAQPRKRRCTKTQRPVCDTALSMRAAWKDYLTRVLPSSARNVRNFLLATMAEGRNAERDDTAADAAAKMPPLLVS